jgi:hypothetical protein
MDALTFISNMIRALAWPLIVLVIIIIIRKPLFRLIPLVRELKYKDLNIKFGEELEKLSDQADEANLPSSLQSEEMIIEFTPEAGYWESIEKISDISPRAAIVEAWRRVEWILNDYFRKNNIEPPSSYQAKLRILREQKDLPTSFFSLFDKLRILRNKAVHARDIDIDSQNAIEFAQLADRIVKALEK